MNKEMAAIKRIRAACMGVLLMCAASPLAGATRYESGPQPAQLLELYTSQGCSSCPPADQWLSQFKTDKSLWKQVIPVAFHVTYWDWIGWRDVFANKQFDARQKRYRKERAISSVYTPGFLVDGKEWRGWFSRSALPAPAPRSGRLTADLEQKQISLHYAADSMPNRIRYHVAILGFDLTTPVSRGENASKSLAEDFVVLWYQEMESPPIRWQSSLPDHRSLPGNRHGIALWVTEANTGALLQTAGGWL